MIDRRQMLKAGAAMGATFDIRAFHDAVLGRGRAPLEILEQAEQNWIARVKS